MGLVIAGTEWMWATRVIRAQVLTLREREFVRVAKLSGGATSASSSSSSRRTLVPFLAASFVNAVTTAILASIGLEVLGLGPRQSYTLGNTIYEATYYTAMWRGMWWWWGPPIAILVVHLPRPVPDQQRARPDRQSEARARLLMDEPLLDICDLEIRYSGQRCSASEPWTSG